MNTILTPRHITLHRQSGFIVAITGIQDTLLLYLHYETAAILVTHAMFALVLSGIARPIYGAKNKHGNISGITIDLVAIPLN